MKPNSPIVNSLLNNQDELFEKTLKYIRSATFRNPIKNFVDKNCSTFSDKESKVEHNDIHKVSSYLYTKQEI